MVSRYMFRGAAALVITLSMISCDTTEDAYHLGDLSDVRMSTVPVNQLRLAADGKAQDIDVTSNVYWNVETLGNRFIVKALTNKGDGKITVEGPVNFNTEQTPSETVLITARDFDKEIRVEVIQARLRFEMSDKSYPEIPEEGGDVVLQFNSSIDWQFVARSGDLSWFDFNPGVTGAGDWDEIKVTATWKPNYTTSARSVELQLRPTDSEVLQFITLPTAFTLTQAAGTLPMNLGIRVEGEAGLTECPLSINYTSKAPVKECGVILTRNGNETRIPATAPAGGFPKTGSVSLTVTGLDMLTTYEAHPYVISEVGETIGETTVSFTTKTDVTWTGAAITGVEITPTSNKVSAKISVVSDCELVEGGIYIFDTTGYQIVKYTVTLTGMSQTFECESVDFMQQNTEYLLQPFVVYRDPKTGNIEVKSDQVQFKTTTRIPTEDDNNPIE